jgi:2-oxo-3-hexenedioate decarboxylase
VNVLRAQRRYRERCVKYLGRNTVQSYEHLPSIDSMAGQLLRAQDDRTAVAPLTDCHELDTEMAFRIQDEALSQRIEGGENIVGIKLSFSSKSRHRRNDVCAPLTAWLTDAMTLHTGAPLPQELLILPRIEPSMVFVMGRRLAGPGVTAAAALAAVDLVFAGLEVTDSRYLDDRFTIADEIADNMSSAYYLTGAVGAAPAGLDLRLEGCLLSDDGGIVATGVGAAGLGHPAEALAMAANNLAQRGHAVEAGWIVVIGGVSDAVAASGGTTFTARFTHLGAVGLRC